MPSRRLFLNKGSHLCAAAIAGSTFGSGVPAGGSPTTENQKFLLIDLVGSENPTRANFPFVWAAALKEAGHEVRVLRDLGRHELAKVVELKIPIFV